MTPLERTCYPEHAQLICEGALTPGCVWRIKKGEAGVSPALSRNGNGNFLSKPECPPFTNCSCDPSRSKGYERDSVFAHLARRSGGEGQREDPLRLLRAGVDGIRDAVGDRARLAGARAGEDAERARRRERDLTLLGVETGQDVVGRGQCAQDDSPFDIRSTSEAWSCT